MDGRGLNPSKDKWNFSFQQHVQNGSISDPNSHSMCVVSCFLRARLLKIEANHLPSPVKCGSLHPFLLYAYILPTGKRSHSQLLTHLLPVLFGVAELSSQPLLVLYCHFSISSSNVTFY